MRIAPVKFVLSVLVPLRLQKRNSASMSSACCRLALVKFEWLPMNLYINASLKFVFVRLERMKSALYNLDRRKDVPEKSEWRALTFFIEVSSKRQSRTFAPPKSQPLSRLPVRLLLLNSVNVNPA